MNKESQGVIVPKILLDQNYWDAQYKANTTAWDLGLVSPPIKRFIDTLQDKDIAILIPGCGNTYEAAYLLEQGFTNVTVIDIAPTLVKIIEDKFSSNTNIQVVLGDFFNHQGQYDLIIEQTFFCALPPEMRQKYAWKMHDLLAKDGRLSGLLFNRTFEAGPPFGGSHAEYEFLFKNAFDCIKLEKTDHSIAPRSNCELFFEFKKNSSIRLNLYGLEGSSGNFSKDNLTKMIANSNGILSISMNTTATELLITSTIEIEIEELQKIVSTDDNYKIKKIKQ